MSSQTERFRELSCGCLFVWDSKSLRGCEDLLTSSCEWWGVVMGFSSGLPPLFPLAFYKSSRAFSVLRWRINSSQLPVEETFILTCPRDFWLPPQQASRGSLYVCVREKLSVCLWIYGLWYLNEINSLCQPWVWCLRALWWKSEDDDLVT